MKRKHKNLVQLAILAALSLVLILSAYIREISWPESEKDRTEISVIFREWESGIWTEERRGMERAAADFGAELRFLTLQESNSAEEQRLLMEQELKNGADEPLPRFAAASHGSRWNPKRKRTASRLLPTTGK